jgi:hypothetical protein
MRRFSLRAAAAASIVASATALAIPGTAGAQTPNPTAFCSARTKLAPSSSPEEAKSAIATMAQSAGGVAIEPATALESLYAKKGPKTFNSDKAFGYLSSIDEYVYANCAGTPVAVTAVDYEFEGMPSTLPAGLTKIKFTNSAPKEDHELAIFRLLPAAEGQDPLALLKMPEKKAAKFADLDSAVFTYAPAGEQGYTVTELEPGKYVFACFIPVDGKNKNAPHFMEGMYGTFTVS